MTTRWAGRCPACGGWGTLREEEASAATSAPRLGQSSATVPLRDVSASAGDRLSTGVGELDRVLGGGLVAGSVILVGGEPGIGKSTLLLQVAHALSLADQPVLYVSGEESPQQVRVRADRLGLRDSGVRILTATELVQVEQTVEAEAPRVAVVDSIQTLRSPEVESAAGSVAQVRECTARLAELAKRSGTVMLLVGHVTKDGTLAGPKVMEHIVDAVLLFEGDRAQSLKVLRATKNRYGSTNEVGLFDMRDQGLIEVPNPSSLLLEERAAGATGTVACSTLEGSRPLLLEVQALVAPTPFTAPRRVVSGLDTNRLHLILAVIEQHAGIKVSHQDVYVNVVGGVRITEPAADLAVALAVASSVLGRAMAPEVMAFGEVGLTGEVRAVNQSERRLEEAARLGFRLAVVPRRGVGRGGLELRPVATLREAVAVLARDAQVASSIPEK